MQNWQLQDAKARMSELVKRAQLAPQSITVHGEPVAVLVSRKTFDTLSQNKVTLTAFMQASPWAEADDLVVQREGGNTRTVKL